MRPEDDRARGRRGSGHEEAVTDSAAAATAYSTGVRSYNGAIGVDVDGSSVPTLLTVKAGQALDETVALALQFASGTPGTLVLVVGDHETGGLAIENVDPEDENGQGEQSEDQIAIANSDLMMSIDWTTGGHTGAATPITAQGPGAERLGKVLRTPTCTTLLSGRWACRGGSGRQLEAVYGRRVATADPSPDLQSEDCSDGLHHPSGRCVTRQR